MSGTDLFDELVRIGALSEAEVQECLRHAYQTDPTAKAAKNSGASEGKIILLLLILLRDSRERAIALMESSCPVDITIPP